MANSFRNKRSRQQPSRASPLLWVLAVACALSGCHERSGNPARAQTAGCSARVIVRFVTEPNSALLAELEQANALELEPAGTITNDLRVYTLRAASSDENCAAAIDRLRRDERVRSVDLDASRELHDEPSTPQGRG